MKLLFSVLLFVLTIPCQAQQVDTTYKAKKIVGIKKQQKESKLEQRIWKSGLFIVGALFIKTLTK